MTPGYGDRILVAPTWEPVSLAEAKSQCRVRASIDDAWFSNILIPAAREFVETCTKRAIPQQQWEVSYDAFPGRQSDEYRPPTWRYGIIRMPRPPLISVESVSYISPEQFTPPFTYTTLAVSQYMVDIRTEPGRVGPAPSVVWPATNPLVFQAVKVAFTAGWASADLVPARLKMAILLTIAHLYEYREAGLPKAIMLIPVGLRAFISASSTWEYQ